MSSYYEEIKEKVKNIDLPCTGENEDGEDVIIEWGKDEAGAFFRTTTIQKNNWDGMIFTDKGCVSFGLDLIRNLKIA